MPPDPHHCPFPGIKPFSYDDREVFFERDDEAQQLIQLIVLYRGVLLYAASGVGKSSLINARLLSLALAQRFQPARLRVQPRHGEEIVAEPLPFPTFLAGREERAILSLEALRERLKAQRLKGGTERPLLIFDQFEEWVTLFEGDGAREPKEKILGALVSLIQDKSLPVKILLVLREDYLARLEPLFTSCPSLPDHYVRLTALRREQIHRVIRGPFDEHPGLYKTEISAKLAGQLEAELAARADSEGTPPTEVQIGCRRLFEAGEEGKDPEKVFEDEGGVQGLLERFLEHALDDLEPDLREPAVSLLARMVTPAGTRNVINRDDLIGRVASEDSLPKALLGDALDCLEKETHLVRRELRREVYFYEIVSEFLVGWIKRRAEALSRERAERRARQDEALRKEQAERRVRRLRWIGAGVAAAGLLFAGLAIFAGLGWVSADRQQQLLTSQLLAQGGDESDQSRDLLLAIEAVRHAQAGLARRWGLPPAASTQGASTLAEAEGKLRLVLGRVHGQIPGGPGHQVRDAILTGDGRWMVAIEPSGALDLWEATSTGLDAKPVPLDGTMSRLAAADASADGRWVAAAGGDDKVLIWDRISGHSYRVKTDERTVSSVVVSPDGRLLITAGAEKAPEFWDLATVPPSRPGKPLRCESSQNVRWKLSPGRKWLAIACNDGAVLTLNLSSVGAAVPLRAHQVEVAALGFSAGDDRLVTGDQAGQICFWRLPSTGQPPECLKLSRKIADLALSPDGLWLAVLDEDGTASLERLAGGSPAGSPAPFPGSLEGFVWSHGGHSLAAWRKDAMALSDNPEELVGPSAKDAFKYVGVTNASFSPNDRWLAAAAGDGTFFMVERGLGGRSFGNRDTRSPKSLAFTADSTWLVTREETGTVRLWDLGATVPLSGPEPLILARHQGAVTALAMSSVGPGLLLSTGESCQILIWRDPASRMRSPESLSDTGKKPLGDLPPSLTVGPSGRWLATLGYPHRDDGAQLWDLLRGPGPARAGHPATDWAESPDPDRRWIVLHEKSDLFLWDLSTTTPSSPLPTGVSPAPAERILAVSPGADWFLVSASDGDVSPHLWDRKTLPPSQVPLPRTAGGLTVAAFSPDGRWLVTGDRSGVASLWDLEPSRKLAPEHAALVNFNGKVTIAAFTADSQRIAIGSERGEIALLSLAEWRRGAAGSPFLAHDGYANALAFSPDGRWMASSGGVTARLWDLTAEHPAASSVVLATKENLRAVMDLVFDPKSRWLFTGNLDGTIRRWRLDKADLLDLACRAAGRNLTQDEWKQVLPGEPYRKTCPDFP